MRFSFVLTLFALGAMAGIPFGMAQAQQTLADASASSTPGQADQISAQISELKNEIAQLQTQLNATTQQKQTLQSAVNGLNLNIKKITASINLTNAQIRQTDAQISALSGGIATTTGALSLVEQGIRDSLQELAQLDGQPLALLMLAGAPLSTLFEQQNTLEEVRSDLQNRTLELSDLKVNLTTSKTASQQKRDQLSALENSLAEQKQGLAIAQTSQTQLLQQTQNQEANYQTLIAQKEAQEAQFEQQLLNAGSQLNLTVNGLPPPGPILSWPVDNTAITQYFGNTDFATQNPQVYNGHGHDGIDLRASPGTPVHAALEGVVVGEGNTDLTCPGASFGKWIFIQHPNGISTMYAHLAAILVAKGDVVSTGQLIAYSDTTGYAIGPHLHFGVYATSGTVIEQLPTAKKCTLVIPVATLSAYLNPLTYLPPLPK